MTKHLFEVGAGYDPLLAVGRRLGTPVGREFFDRHIDVLTKAFGGDLVQDIAAVSERHDVRAAERLCTRLCPGTTFSVTEEEHSIAIAYENGRIKGVHTVDTDPFFRLSSAVALAGASMKLNAEMRSRMVAVSQQPFDRQSEAA